MSATAATTETLKRTPLHALHVALGARMVAFAGYEMPVHYRLGVLKEHLHTRAAAGLFDVSHMGQALLAGRDHETVAAALETVVPGDIRRLKRGRQRYTVLLNDAGGIVDDMMVTRAGAEGDDGRLMLVVNASRKASDYAYLAERLPTGVRLEALEDRALLALQGPRAAEILEGHCPGAAGLAFMAAAAMSFDGVACHVTRSGYTGEDGFELSVAADRAEEVARTLLEHELVEPAGLGARDSLRLEAGLCLYGHDIDETTSPVEADLAWTIGKRRRGEGGFAGASRIQRELREGPARVRVGIRPEGRAPAREGTPILDANGGTIGTVTSGGFGPTVDGPVAMGYVAAQATAPGTPVQLLVRGTARPASVAALPFVPHRYHK